MEIKTTLDKCVIPAEELQDVVKNYIRSKIGREVQGFVNYDLKPGSSQMPTAYYHLKPAQAGT